MIQMTVFVSEELGRSVCSYQLDKVIWKQCLHPIGLWGIFVTNNWCVKSQHIVDNATPGQVFQGKVKASQAMEREQASKPCSSTAPLQFQPPHCCLEFLMTDNQLQTETNPPLSKLLFGHGPHHSNRKGKEHHPRAVGESYTLIVNVRLIRTPDRVCASL